MEQCSSDVEAPDSEGSLNSIDPHFSNHRTRGRGYHVVARQFASGDSEMVALKLDHDQRLTKGGGAKRENQKKSDMSDVALGKSQARARKNVRHRCMSICVDRLMTLTFRENLTDIDDAWKKLDYFHRLMRWRFKDQYKFVVVPEYQKRGAVHFHLAIAGYYHANTVRKLWRRASGSSGGNIDITSPKKHGKKSWSPRRIAQYISKYISKSDSVEFNRKRYASSKNIAPPVHRTAWLQSGGADFLHLHNLFQKLAGRRSTEFVEIDGYFPVTMFNTT